MTEKIKELLQKYRHEILYLIFGGVTTLVDFAVSFLLYRLGWNVHIADTLAWIAAVSVAYVTNRIWVFESKKYGFFSILLEIATFASSRLLTLGMQELLVLLLFDVWNWNKYLVKIIAAVAVVISNYFLSKWIVFRKEKQKS